jgi:hypothetical protein
MPPMDETLRQNLIIVARILGRCILVGFAIALIWFGAYESGVLCSLHGKLFPMSEHECALLSYGGIGIFKLFIFTFFLIPWIAIKLELRRRK